MVDPVRPLRLSTVIWFGSLEFISLGCEYDMVLLTPRAPPTDDDVMHKQPRHRRRPGRCSRRARQARREQNHPNTAQVQGNAPRPTSFPCPAVGAESMAGDLSSLSLGKGKTPVARSDALPSSFAPPPPEESTPTERSPAMAPSPYPFELSNAAAYAFAYASTHAESSGCHQHFALDLIATTSTHSHTDSA